jgi:AraC family L-rhamnose operon regulatory protein RhaS
LRSDPLSGINPIGFWTGSVTQDWGLAAHRNEGVEITFLETGRMPFTVEANDFELRAAEIGITGPWPLHNRSDPNIGPGKRHWLILDVGVRRPNQEWRWPRWLTMTDDDARNSLKNSGLMRTRCGTRRQTWLLHSRDYPTASKSGPPLISSPGCSRYSANFSAYPDGLGQTTNSSGPGLTSRRRTVHLFLRDLATNPSSTRPPWTLQQMAKHGGLGITAFSQYCRDLLTPVRWTT